MSEALITQALIVLGSILGGGFGWKIISVYLKHMRERPGVVIQAGGDVVNQAISLLKSYQETVDRQDVRIASIEKGYQQCKNDHRKCERKMSIIMPIVKEMADKTGIEIPEKLSEEMKDSSNTEGNQ